MDHDLLDVPLLSYRDAQRRRGKTTLPGLLSRLASGELGDFARLRAHQLHPWCMFLTQLAAIAMHRAGREDPRLPEEEWRRLLLALTAGKHEPWCLVVEDLAEPAFFQPPVPERTLDGWKDHYSPDEVDVLVTAKAHDVKTGQIPGHDIEGWVYAIATTQTMQGYPGRGYHGIARMNGGYGSRPRVGLAADQSLTARFLRDLDVLRASWPNLVVRGYRDDGLALAWTAAWDGQTSLAMDELVPHFIEVCSRLRCVGSPGGLVCRYTTTQARRCLREIDNGDVGDPWAPIERNKGALSVGRRGFHYDLLRRLLFENDFEPAATQSLRADDPDPVFFLASALARGQGKTEGLHERELALTGPARRQLFQPDARAVVGTRAAERVQSAQTMRSRVLYPALKQLASTGEVADDFDARVDEVFFDHLFATLGDSDEAARLAWERRLREIASQELQTVILRCSAPCARRFKVVSAAEGMFIGCLKKNFPDLVAAEPTTEGASS